MPNRRTTLAERLAWALRESGMTQAELCRQAGIRQPSLHGLMSGRYRRSRFAGELARALGVDASWLATGAGTPRPDISPEALALAQRWEALPPQARREVASYLEYVTARLSDPDTRDPDPAAAVTQRSKT